MGNPELGSTENERKIKKIRKRRGKEITKDNI